MWHGTLPGTKLLTGSALFSPSAGCNFCFVLLQDLLSCSRVLCALHCRNLVLACGTNCADKKSDRTGKWAAHMERVAHWQAKDPAVPSSSLSFTGFAVNCALPIDSWILAKISPFSSACTLSLWDLDSQVCTSPSKREPREAPNLVPH